MSTVFRTTKNNAAAFPEGGPQRNAQGMCVSAGMAGRSPGPDTAPTVEPGVGRAARAVPGTRLGRERLTDAAEPAFTKLR